jgi:glycyl-tRNA synthetase beta chain
VDARERLIALTDLARQTGFNELIVAFKRVMNILPSGFEGDIRGNMLQQESERELYRHYQSVATRILPMMNLPAGQAGASRYQETLREMVSLKPLIDQFFDRVLVMDPDTTVRQNRLGLLRVLRDLFESFADFSKIQEGESKKE